LLASRLDAAQHGQALGDEMQSREALDLMALAAEEGSRVGASLDVAPGLQHSLAEMQGNSRLLRRLLRNLLENAQRHAGAHQHGLINSLSTEKDENNPAITLRLDGDAVQLRIEVSDHGPGVPLDERERIFEPFYRSSRASESTGGVGLGLSLVKSIAQQHGGSVRCQARADGQQGACFVVSLPRSR
jgi:two-component system, OmpR family, sensor kinase